VPVAFVLTASAGDSLFGNVWSIHKSSPGGWPRAVDMTFATRQSDAINGGIRKATEDFIKGSSNGLNQDWFYSFDDSGQNRTMLEIHTCLFQIRPPAHFAGHVHGHSPEYLHDATDHYH
jgi:hypothetical protein